MQLASKNERRLDTMDLEAGRPVAEGDGGGQMERRMEAAEQALERLAGNLDVKAEMDLQAKQLAELFAKKAGKDELASAVRKGATGLEEQFQSELEEKAAKMAELIAMAKHEMQEGLGQMGMTVETKADREWLDELEAKIRQDILAASNGKITEAQLQARLAELRKALEEAMAGMNKSEGSFLSFRCLACDRPLPPSKEWKNKARAGGPANSIRSDGPPPPEHHNGSLAAAQRKYPGLGDTQSLHIGSASPEVVLRGGFPMTTMSSLSATTSGITTKSQHTHSTVRSSRAVVTCAIICA